MSGSTLTHRRIRRLVRTRLLVAGDRAGGGPPPDGPGVSTADRAIGDIAAGRGRSRLHRLLRDDAGMSTVEYAIGCIAAAAFAAALYAVVSGDSVVTALTQLVQRALTACF